MIQDGRHFNHPAAYVRQIPDGTSTHWQGFDYHVLSGGVIARYATPKGANLNGLGRVELIANLQLGDPFPQAAIAQFPNGLSYVKTGNAWLLAPIRIASPIVLTERVGGCGEYWIIKQTPYTYTGSRHVNKPSVIQFNVPLLSAKEGDFPGANEPVFPTRKPTAKISIAVDVPLMTPWSGSLQSSSQVNASVTKGRLAERIVDEVELKALDASNKTILAYFKETLIQEVSLQDLFLVDLVQRLKGTFQPTIAIRVPPVDEPQPQTLKFA